MRQVTERQFGELHVTRTPIQHDNGSTTFVYDVAYGFAIIANRDDAVTAMARVRELALNAAEVHRFILNVEEQT